ncbi:MAG: hypothetical protein O2826_07355 [Chloroflexi bacterium]|nr:hypothetical protein [Chloroflexota bacterium]
MARRLSDNRKVRLRAGVIAGSIAAVVGSLANLPLEAPTDTLFNAATVTAASLLAGTLAGLLWLWLASNPYGPIVFCASLAVAFAVVAAAAIALDGQVDRAASYLVPLAAIVLGIVGAATPLLARALHNAPAWIVAAALAVAVIVGGSLATQGDAESGTLTLPPRSSTKDVIR